MDPIVLTFFLALLVIIYLGFFFLHILWKTPKLENKLQSYYYGIAFFLIMFMICRILFLVNDIIYYATQDEEQKQGVYYILGSFVSGLAALGIMYVVEKYIMEKKNKYIPSFIIFLFSMLILIVPRLNGVNLVAIYNIVISLITAVIPFLYISVGLKVNDRPRTKSFILAFGLILFYIGNLLNMGLLKDAVPILIILSPITLILGLAIFEYGLLGYNIEN
ncbi:MAG: hypothetical protein ACTSR8_01220 [Promethearchaeota archaeon]